MIPLEDPEGHRWVRPANPDCPNCDCCTAVLCERGRENVFGCLGRSSDFDPDVRKRVGDCPCSAGTTPGTAAYRTIHGSA